MKITIERRDTLEGFDDLPLKIKVIEFLDEKPSTEKQHHAVLTKNSSTDFEITSRTINVFVFLGSIQIKSLLSFSPSAGRPILIGLRKSDLESIEKHNEDISKAKIVASNLDRNQKSTKHESIELTAFLTFVSITNLLTCAYFFYTVDSIFFRILVIIIALFTLIYLGKV